MSYAKEMWDLLNKIVQPTSDKIVCPITGGLDSRVLAYILSLKGVRVISYYIYNNVSHFENFRHIERLCEICNVEDHLFIGAKFEDMDTVNRIVNTKYNTKEYQYYLPSFNDLTTGGSLTKKRDRWCWINKKIFYSSLEDNYKEVVKPTLNPRWLGYCYSLPRSQRFLQKAYIDMIKEYTPLASVPRCFERGETPHPLDKGFIYYSLVYSKHKIKRGWKL